MIRTKPSRTFAHLFDTCVRHQPDCWTPYISHFSTDLQLLEFAIPTSKILSVLFAFRLLVLINNIPTTKYDGPEIYHLVKTELARGRRRSQAGIFCLCKKRNIRTATTFRHQTVCLCFGPNGAEWCSFGITFPGHVGEFLEPHCFGDLSYRFESKLYIHIECGLKDEVWSSIRFRVAFAKIYSHLPMPPLMCHQFPEWHTFLSIVFIRCGVVVFQWLPHRHVFHSLVVNS